LAPAAVRDGAGGPELVAATKLIAASRAAADSPGLRAGALVTVCAMAAVRPAPAGEASTAPSAGAAPTDAASIAAAQAAAMSMQAVRRRRPTAPGRTITSMRTIADETESWVPPWSTGTGLSSAGGLECLAASISYAVSYIYMDKFLARREGQAR
jgi:hypothetical protein